MDTYTPLWSKIVDSSLWDEPDYVVKVFLTLLAKKDRDNVVRGTAYNIGRWARKQEVEVLEALRILSSPDTKRVEPQPHEGRRIEKVEDGWLILNGEYYRAMMQRVKIRAQKTESERLRRKVKKTSSTLEERVGAPDGKRLQEEADAARRAQQREDDLRPKAQEQIRASWGKNV